MPQPRLPTFIFQTVEQAENALRAAARCDTAIRLRSGPSLAVALGPRVVLAMIANASGTCSVDAARYVAEIDCTDEFGLALAALDAGATAICVRCDSAAKATLAGIAARLGASLETEPSAGSILALSDMACDIETCEQWLKNQRETPEH